MPADGTHNPPQIDYVAGEGKSGTLTPEPTQATGTGASLPYRVLERKSPEYDAGYWSICKGLYAGGKRLFRDKKILEHIFPKHRHEDGS